MIVSGLCGAFTLGRSVKMARNIKNDQSQQPIYRSAKMHPQLEDNIGFLLHRSARILRGMMAEALQDLELSFHEYVVLRMIEMDFVGTQKEVGRLNGIDRTSMVELIDRMEERGLVVRNRDENDRRKHKLTMTPKGKKVFTHAKRLATKAHKKFLAPLDEGQAELLKNFLKTIITAEDKQNG